MSEGSFWPKTWKEAVPLIVWGILIFAAGFEGIASLVHGEWVSSVASFAIMLGLTAMLLHWKAWLEKLNPNWVAGAAIALLIVIAISPFVQQWQMPTLSWKDVGIGIFGTLLVAAIVGAAISPFVRNQEKAAKATPLVEASLDGQTRLDLLHLLDFSVNETTYWMLDRLLEIAVSPEVTDGFKNGPDTAEAHNSRQYFIGYARQQFGAGTFRHSDYVNLMHNAEVDAELDLKSTPQDQWPPGIDPLTLRQYKISELQFRRAVQFVGNQRREVREKLVNQRHQLIDRVRERENNK